MPPRPISLSKLKYDFQETRWHVILLICHCFPVEFFVRECNRNLRAHTSEKDINICLKHNVKTKFTCSWGFVISLAQLCGFQKYCSWFKEGNDTFTWSYSGEKIWNPRLHYFSLTCIEFSRLQKNQSQLTRTMNEYWHCRRSGKPNRT